jgi:hypothetical protein
MADGDISGIWLIFCRFVASFVLAGVPSRSAETGFSVEVDEPQTLERAKGIEPSYAAWET